MLNKINIIVWIIVAVIIIGIAVYFGRGMLQERSPFYVNLDQTAVVKEMRALQRLETVTFTLEKIVEAGTTTNTQTAIERFLVGDKLLMIAHGQVIAGFDMEKMNDNDIQISEGGVITVNMPAPQILVSRLDNEKTRVYDRSQGILTKGDKDLESEARRQAEESIRQASCDEGILDQASENGRKQLTAFLGALGFTSVTIIIPQGQCR